MIDRELTAILQGWEVAVTAKTKIGSCVFMLGVLVIAGCASETAKKPESSASPKSSASSAQAPAGKSSASSSQSQSGSSLDALREGKGLASGPLKEIRFDFDSYDLTSEARAIL